MPVSDHQAAVRELREETGLTVAENELVGPFYTRTVVHGYSDKVVDQAEVFLLVRAPAFEVDTAGHTEEELLTVADIRWWTRRELLATDDDVAARPVLDVRAVAGAPGVGRPGQCGASRSRSRPSRVMACSPDGHEDDGVAVPQGAARAVLWKVDGLPEKDQRMPLTRPAPTCSASSSTSPGSRRSTSACVDGLATTMAFQDDDAEPNADMWATEDESARQILDLYRRVTAFADETIEPLPLDAGVRRGGALPRPTSTPSSCTAVETLRGTHEASTSCARTLDGTGAAAVGAQPPRRRHGMVGCPRHEAASHRGADSGPTGHGAWVTPPRPAARGKDQDDHWADRPAVRQPSAAPPWDDVERMLTRGTALLDRHGHQRPTSRRVPLVGVPEGAFAFCTGPDERTGATSRPTRRWR